MNEAHRFALHAHLRDIQRRVPDPRTALLLVALKVSRDSGDQVLIRNEVETVLQ